MRKKIIPYYWALLIFYVTYNVLFIGLSLIIYDHPNSEDDFIFVLWVILYIMIVAGIYIISFVYGLYFQNKYRLSWLQIVLLSMAVFAIEIVAFWPLWKPNPLQFDLDTQHLLWQAGLQSLCFFAGCTFINFRISFKRAKQKKNN